MVVCVCDDNSRPALRSWFAASVDKDFEAVVLFVTSDWLLGAWVHVFHESCM